MFFGINNSILGLDIGSSHMKIAHLKQHRQNWKLINWAIVKTPEDTILDGKILNKDKLVGVLIDILAKYKFNERKVVTAVSNLRIVTRYITMPQMPEKELNQAVNWEAKNHIPIYDENMKIDFKVLGKADDNRTRLVITGISKQTSLEYLDMLTDAGLKPVAIDIYPVSLQRFFGGSGSRQPFCIVDLGAFHTKLVIIQEDSIYTDSIIPVGIKEIQDNLIDYFGIQEEQLESWQQNFSIASYREKQEYADLFQIIILS
jgi:type IV pilus assembly protein PilM